MLTCQRPRANLDLVAWSEATMQDLANRCRYELGGSVEDPERFSNTSARRASIKAMESGSGNVKAMLVLHEGSEIGVRNEAKASSASTAT